MKDKKEMYLLLQVDKDVTEPDIRSALSDKGITRCILRPLPEYDWSSFRREAAKDVLAAIISGDKLHCPLSCVEASNVAIQYADELIKQLQRKINEQLNTIQGRTLRFVLALARLEGEKKEESMNAKEAKEYRESIGKIIHIARGSGYTKEQVINDIIVMFNLITHPRPAKVKLKRKF